MRTVSCGALLLIFALSRSAFGGTFVAVKAPKRTSPGAAPAEELVQDGTAALLPKGRALLRVTGESRYGLTPRFELRSTLGAWLMLVPNVDLRERVYVSKDLLVSTDYGFSIPSFSTRLLSGYLFPTNEVTGEALGFAIVPHLGIKLTVPIVFLPRQGSEFGTSRPGRRAWLTSALDIRGRISAGGRMPTSLDTYAPIELAYAPYTTGYRTSASVTYKSPMSENTRLDIALLADRTGKRSEGLLSPLFLGGRVELQMNLSATFAFTFGATVYNYDQGATRIRIGNDGVAKRERIRQTDLYPSADLAWLF
ncbi:MAG: hypothetical protein SFV15_13285 [Polyangiaceae bacterium]|nr:hypothetical protein [Polyangiaceae bacterium]